MRYIGIFIIGCIFLLFNSIFVMHEVQQGLVLEFGEIKRVVKNPGLHFKIPFIQNVMYFEKRLIDFDLPPQEVVAGDQKRIVVDLYARYKIYDPLKFYKTMQNLYNAKMKLMIIFQGTLRNVIGANDLNNLLSNKRSIIMDRIQDDIKKACIDFGIEVIDVRIKKADLPKENSEAIFRRMETERQVEAQKIRAEGSETSKVIKSATDKEAAIIIAKSRVKAAEIEGLADAEFLKITSKAYGKDKEFFEFYKTLEIYKKSLSDSVVVIDPKSNQFFDFIK